MRRGGRRSRALYKGAEKQRHQDEIIPNLLADKISIGADRGIQRADNEHNNGQYIKGCSP